MDHKLTDDEILDRVNNMPLDEMWADKQEGTAEKDDGKQAPLFAVGAAVFIIATINSIYFHSDGALFVCVILGGGIWYYLWRLHRRAYQSPKRKTDKTSSDE